MALYYPRCWITVSGARIPCISARVHRKAQRDANEFSAHVSITKSAQYGLDFAGWADLNDTEASIEMALGQESKTMMSGNIDMPEHDCMTNTVHVKGRDKAAKLINAKVNKEYKNKTAGEIVEDIAKKVGLQAQVSSDDQGKAGKIYVEDTMHLIADKSAFAAVSGLADRLGYRWYVDGDTLYFEPDENDKNEFEIRFTPPKPGETASGNILSLHLSRNMEAARPTEVITRGFHRKDKKLYESKKKAGGVGDDVTYEHHHNNHKQEHLDTISKSRLKNVIRHELMMDAHMHADLSVDVRQKANVTGTGSIYDQAYDVDEIEFDIGWGRGATMRLKGKSAKEGRDSGE